jgi:hypothetical protein
MDGQQKRLLMQLVGRVVVEQLEEIFVEVEKIVVVGKLVSGAVGKLVVVDE